MDSSALGSDQRRLRAQLVLIIISSSALLPDQRQLRAQLGLTITSSSALGSDQKCFRTQLGLQGILSALFFFIFCYFFYWKMLILPRGSPKAAFWSETHLKSDSSDRKKGVHLIGTGLVIVWIRSGQWSESESGPWSEDGLIRTPSIWKVWSETFCVWKVWSEVTWVWEVWSEVTWVWKVWSGWISVWKVWSEIILVWNVWSNENLGLDLNLGCTCKLFPGALSLVHFRFEFWKLWKQNGSACGQTNFT